MRSPSDADSRTVPHASYGWEIGGRGGRAEVAAFDYYRQLFRTSAARATVPSHTVRDPSRGHQNTPAPVAWAVPPAAHYPVRTNVCKCNGFHAQYIDTPCLSITVPAIPGHLGPARATGNHRRALPSRLWAGLGGWSRHPGPPEGEEGVSPLQFLSHSNV